MTHASNEALKRSQEAVLREAREARDKALAALIVSAAKGCGSLTAMTGRMLVRAGRSVVSGAVTAQRRRAAIRELQALNDRQLRDIGVSRGDIPFVIERQLSAKGAASTGSGKDCDIAAFPDRPTSPESPSVRLRPAA